MLTRAADGPWQDHYMRLSHRDHTQLGAGLRCRAATSTYTTTRGGKRIFAGCRPLQERCVGAAHHVGTCHKVSLDCEGASQAQARVRGCRGRVHARVPAEGQEPRDTHRLSAQYDLELGRPVPRTLGGAGNRRWRRRGRASYSERASCGNVSNAEPWNTSKRALQHGPAHCIAARYGVTGPRTAVNVEPCSTEERRAPRNA
jgi:hypothetical protein